MRTRSVPIILVGLALFLCGFSARATAKDLQIRFTDKSRLEYEGDWSIISYQAYTSKSVGSGARKGTLTCRPGLSGTFQILAEFKSTENRGTRGRYFVNGSLAKEVDQRGGTGKGQSSFRKVSLGVFALTPDSTVELRAEDGRSYSFVSFTFTGSTAPPSGGDDPAVPPDGGDTPDQAGPGMTALRDGKMTIRPFLSTYQPAELRVLVDGKEVLAWVRGNSTARELCRFRGKADEASMIQRGPGDYSPAPGLCYEYPLKAGQKVTVIKKGRYQPATFLKVEGPFGSAALDDVLGGD